MEPSDSTATEVIVLKYLIRIAVDLFVCLFVIQALPDSVANPPGHVTSDEGTFVAGHLTRTSNNVQSQSSSAEHRNEVVYNIILYGGGRGSSRVRKISHCVAVCSV